MTGEQYVGLAGHFWGAFCWCLGAILFGAVAVLRDPVAAGFITLSSGIVVVQLYGLMALFSMKMSAIPAVSLIMALGIAVEFTAHLCSAFAFASGTRDERAQAALRHVFVPVLQGGMSSFLGFVMLAFSDFHFIVKYFFGLYSLVVCVGLLNGMLFLPVLLSLVGPAAQGESAQTVPHPAVDSDDAADARAGGGGGGGGGAVPVAFAVVPGGAEPPLASSAAVKVNVKHRELVET